MIHLAEYTVVQEVFPDCRLLTKITNTLFVCCDSVIESDHISPLLTVCIHIYSTFQYRKAKGKALSLVDVRKMARRETDPDRLNELKGRERYLQ